MAKLTIDTGTAGNPATGDTLRTAMTKVNANFTEIYNELGSDGTFSNISFDGNTISTDNTNGDLTIDPNGTGRLVIDATITNTTTNSNITISPNGTGALDVDTSRIINVTDPTSAQDAATKNYVDTQLASSDHNFTFVGDDSTGTAVTQGETFKFAGTQNITTAVSGDTLTITGPDLSNYLNSTQITVSGNKISTTESNANIELDPNGSGRCHRQLRRRPSGRGQHAIPGQCLQEMAHLVCGTGIDQHSGRVHNQRGRHTQDTRRYRGHTGTVRSLRVAI
jgi:hypothetical protein